jgi:hypothetical protein
MFGRTERPQANLASGIMKDTDAGRNDVVVQVIRLLQEVMQATDDVTRFNLMSSNPKLRALMDKVRTDMS